MNTRFFTPINRLLGQALGLAVALAGLSMGQAQQVPVEERTLSNGMKLLMLERHHSPTIAGGWVVRVGSVNERPGITGIAHLFEHMMFKGTPTIGTKDAKRDGEIIGVRQVARLRSEGRVIELELVLAWGLESPRDTLRIEGSPPLSIEIPGGYHGDEGTTAQIVRALGRCAQLPASFYRPIDMPLRFG